MKGEPYNVIWYGFPNRNIKIDLPTYFSNYKYVKVKVKEVFSKSNFFAHLYLKCENFNYDRIYQGTSNAYIGDYVLNLSRYLAGGNKLSSFKIPYKKEINITFDYSLQPSTSSPPIYLSFEFIPVN